MKLVVLTVIALAGGPGLSSPPPAACAVEGASTARGDVARARAACEVARSRFVELFGDPTPRVRIVLWERPGYRAGVQGGTAVVFWPITRAMAERQAGADGGEAYVDLQWEEVLPHEIAHVLLAARFWGTGRAAAAGDGYATPFPDWLDEGVAIWAEPAASRRGRLSEARELPEDRRELLRILDTPHPATGDPRVLSMRDGRIAPENPALWTFYPGAIALLGFVVDEGGTEAMGELARRLVEDPGDPFPLLGLPGLGDDPYELEERWQLWLAKGSGTSLAAR